MYDLRFRILLKKFIVTNNLSLDGMKLKINYSTLEKETKNIENSDEEADNKLPGA